MSRRLSQSIWGASASWLFVTVFISLVVLNANAQTTAANAAPDCNETAKKNVVSVNSSGLWFWSPDCADTLHIHGYVQADDRMFLSNLHGEPVDTFLFRRIRPEIEGTIFNAVDFHFVPDFGQNNPQIQDAYLELKSLSYLKFRAGKFKEPTGLELDRSDRDLPFVERSLVSDLLPQRYMGAEINGSVLSKAISYAAGYFNGSNDGSNGNFQWIAANEFAGRVFALPFAKTKINTLRQLGIGLAGSSANQHGAIAGLKTVAQSTFFKYSSSTAANGSHWRISPQAYYYGGPVGLMSEYAVSSQEVANKGNSGNIINRAWQISGSVMLTGEKNCYGGMRPHHNFEPMKDRHHWGAFEFAMRYSQLQIGSDAFPFLPTQTQRHRERGSGRSARTGI